MVNVVLLLIAVICFALAALGVGVSRINLVAGGLFCWCLTALIGAWPS